jgi:hypothetical protein
MGCGQRAFGDKVLKLNEIAYCKFTVALGRSQFWFFFFLGGNVENLFMNIV